MHAGSRVSLLQYEFVLFSSVCWGFPGGLVVKNPPVNVGDVGWIPGLGRSPGGNGNPLQYSCLRNRMDRGAWWATVRSVTESDMTETTWHTSVSLL